MICGGHKTGRVADHTCCYGQTWYVMLNKEDMESKLGELQVILSREWGGGGGSGVRGEMFLRRSML